MSSTDYLGACDGEELVWISSLETLQKGEEINDEIMNFYLQDHIAKQADVIPLNVVFCNTFNFSNLVTDKRKNIFKTFKKIKNFDDAAYIFIPVHDRVYSHWKLLIMDQKRRDLFLLDSLRGMIGKEHKGFVYFLFTKKKRREKKERGRRGRL
jgi:Ulp1 family protease